MVCRLVNTREFKSHGIRKFLGSALTALKLVYTSIFLYLILRSVVRISSHGSKETSASGLSSHPGKASFSEDLQVPSVVVVLDMPSQIRSVARSDVAVFIPLCNQLRLPALCAQPPPNIKHRCPAHGFMSEVPPALQARLQPPMIEGPAQCAVRATSSIEPIPLLGFPPIIIRHATQRTGNLSGVGTYQLLMEALEPEPSPFGSDGLVSSPKPTLKASPSPSPSDRGALMPGFLFLGGAVMGGMLAAVAGRRIPGFRVRQRSPPNIAAGEPTVRYAED